MWQSELFCFTCCLSRGWGGCVCMCMDLKGYGGGERESESNHLKGKVIHERVRSGKIHSACTSSEHPAKFINFM